MRPPTLGFEGLSMTRVPLGHLSIHLVNSPSSCFLSAANIYPLLCPCCKERLTFSLHTTALTSVWTDSHLWDADPCSSFGILNKCLVGLTMASSHNPPFGRRLSYWNTTLIQSVSPFSNTP
ncbi:hypothetical protein ACJQWK_04181 [Exserohilum turcicum]